MAENLNLETTYTAILKAARQKRFISYGDIAKANGMDWNDAYRKINAHLGELVGICATNDWPIITAIVVNKNDVETGVLEGGPLDGFISAAEELGYYVENPETFLKEQQTAVFEWAETASDFLIRSDVPMPSLNSRFSEYMGPILDALRTKGGTAKRTEVFDWLEENIPSSEKDLQNKYKNGGNAFRGHVNKAATFLRRLGLLTGERGMWTLSKDGQSKVLTSELSQELVSQWRASRRNKAEVSKAPLSKQDGDIPKRFLTPAKNLVLYGPPGTGKTYQTINHAISVLDNKFFQENGDSRELIIQRFRELKDQNRIAFVTFHQSFSYEEFVEGLKAETDDKGQIRYQVQDGVFKTLCESAASQITKSAESTIDIENKTVWKMSLGDTLGEDAAIYDECITNNYILLGYGQGLDYSRARTKEEISKLQSKDDLTASPTSYQVKSVYNFIHSMKIGDLVVVSDGNRKFRAIGKIASEYKHIDRQDEGDYVQCREVEWLRVYSPSLPRDELLDKEFSQMTLYELRPPTLNKDKLKHLLSRQSAKGQNLDVGDFVGGYKVEKVTKEVVTLSKPNGAPLPFTWDMLNTLADLVKREVITIRDIKDKTIYEKVQDLNLEKYLVHGYQNILAPLVERIISQERNFGSENQTDSARVIIIDEINRGNISKIFGELITLIEPNKRAGQSEALSAILPYSKESFSVPDNLYIIGTMNTADRSLTSIDTALRRRFVFEEVKPDPLLLNGVIVDGIDIEKLMSTLNSRIALLLSRDYQLGHSYFLPLKDSPSMELLEHIFERQIIPLLQEYFFDDWEKIHRVLGDHNKTQPHQFIIEDFSNADSVALLGSDWQGGKEKCWIVNDVALKKPEAYQGIYSPILE